MSQVPVWYNYFVMCQNDSSLTFLHLPSPTNQLCLAFLCPGFLIRILYLRFFQNELVKNCIKGFSLMNAKDGRACVSHSSFSYKRARFLSNAENSCGLKRILNGSIILNVFGEKRKNYVLIPIFFKALSRLCVSAWNKLPFCIIPFLKIHVCTHCRCFDSIHDHLSDFGLLLITVTGSKLSWPVEHILPCFELWSILKCVGMGLHYQLWSLEKQTKIISSCDR